MAKSSLLGIEPLNPRAPGHDDAMLGPSDSSDSGSDLTGLDAPDGDDPQLPLDRALADDVSHPLATGDARGGSSDAAGTGERRSAAGDGGSREAGDIGVDRVFSPRGTGAGEAEDDIAMPTDTAPDLAEIPDDADGDTLEDEGGDDTVEDESADPVGDGQSDAALAERLPPRRN